MPAIVDELLRRKLVGETEDRNPVFLPAGFRVRVEASRGSHCGPAQIELGVNAAENARNPRLSVDHVSIGQTPAIPVFLSLGRQDVVLVNPLVVRGFLDQDRIDIAGNDAQLGRAGRGLVRQYPKAWGALPMLGQFASVLEQPDLVPGRNAGSLEKPRPAPLPSSRFIVGRFSFDKARFG